MDGSTPPQALANERLHPGRASSTALAREYTLELATGVLSTGHEELEIHWAGDVARILVDGVPVADRFWDGSPWVLNMHDAGIRPDANGPAKVTLQILPLSPQARVGLPAESQQRREAAAGDLAALDAVHLVYWTGWQEGTGGAGG